MTHWAGFDRLLVSRRRAIVESFVDFLPFEFRELGAGEGPGQGTVTAPAVGPDVRVREFMLGGVTKRILDEMTVPVMMSH